VKEGQEDGMTVERGERELTDFVSEGEYFDIGKGYERFPF
jgi:hypothetical protein